MPTSPLGSRAEAAAAQRLSNRGRVAAVAAAILTLVALVAGVTPEAAAVGRTAGPSYAMEDAFLAHINDARTDRGLQPLRRVGGVDNVAREWSQRMAVDNHLRHRSSLGAPMNGSWQGLGENVGVGYRADSLHDSFMASAGHRDNILGDFDSIGIGVALVGRRAFVAMNFVKGDASTDSRYRRNPLHDGYATGSGTGGPFLDLRGTVHRGDIDTLDRAGVAVSCAETRYCPDDALRRSEMAALLVDALDLPPARERFRDVSSDHPYADEIGALAAAGITKGCNPPANDRFCPEDPVTRQQMASFFVRSLDDVDPVSRRPFRDVRSGNVHSRDIAGLGRSGITKGCNPPSNDRYCPGDDVTRGQMASFITRGIDL